MKLEVEDSFYISNCGCDSCYGSVNTYLFVNRNVKIISKPVGNKNPISNQGIKDLLKSILKTLRGFYKKKHNRKKPFVNLISQTDIASFFNIKNRRMSVGWGESLKRHPYAQTTYIYLRITHLFVVTNSKKQYT